MNRAIGNVNLYIRQAEFDTQIPKLTPKFQNSTSKFQNSTPEFDRSQN